MSRCVAPTAKDSANRAAVTRHESMMHWQCGTCGSTFLAEDALRAHLRKAYHGFQCLGCGAVFACRAQIENHHHLCGSLGILN